MLLLTDVDHDHDGLALAALADRAGYPHAFAAPSNAGEPTGLDLDGNGRTGEARDAQGYGRFPGDSALAVLSRWPVTLVQDHTALLWRDLPGAALPDAPLWTEEVAAIQRLSSTSHWVLSVDAPGGLVTIGAFSATPPVFDGPEDRNGLRNAGEVRFWSAWLDGDFGPVPEDVVLMGNAQLDPVDGEGRHEAIAALLSDPRLQDPAPASAGAALAADKGHAGDPALDTVDWEGPGNLRVGYVLPDAGWTVTGAGVFWPAPDTEGAALLGPDGLAAGPHRLVWVDIAR